MILPFATQWPNGEPTNFIAKIWESLFPFTDIEVDEWMPFIKACRDKKLIPEGNNAEECLNGVVAKPHTMREDEKDRWKPGMKIHMVVFNRTKKQFQFVPVIECKSVQKIEIKFQSTYQDGSPHHPKVIIDGAVFWDYEQQIDNDNEKIMSLAKNDGFDSVGDFFKYFNKDFTGKIIHWTDLRY